MKKTFLVLIINLLFVIIAEEAYSQAGTLDVTFDNDGILIDTVDLGRDYARDVVALDDSTILVCGIGQFNDNGGPYEGIIIKYLNDGSRDQSFGTDGIVHFQYGLNTFAYNIVLQADGKIVVSGNYDITATNSDFFIARYNANGTVDQSFNGNGYLLGTYGPNIEDCNDMLMQSDGKFILAGATYAGFESDQLFMRVNSDGTIDNSFGTNGYSEIDAYSANEEINSLGFLSTGEIIGMGSGFLDVPIWEWRVFMTKLDANGDPVTGFGTNGVQQVAALTGSTQVNSSTVHNDSVYITGNVINSEGYKDLYVSKIDALGVADPSYGTSGMTSVDIDLNNEGMDLLWAGDNKVYVAGYEGDAFNRDFFLLRFGPDGLLDTSFNSVGYASTDIQPGFDEAYSIDMQADGRIVLAGYSDGFPITGDDNLAITRYLNDFNPFFADFTADNNSICSGETINFTDNSGGNPTAWNWTFEGGTPATSTDQNPTVTYNTTGLYDVQLVITDGTNYDTLLRQDYIEVVTTPGQATTPAGGTNACAGSNINYTTNSVQFATSYQWEVDPPDAGNMNGTGTTATFESSASFSGSYTIKVRANNMCGVGPWSPDFQGNLVASPQAFTLQGDGAYCEGSQGAELTLDGSETGVDYELYLDDVATGNIVAGTGSSISFGYVTDEGIYTAVGSDSGCETDMYGQIWVHMVGIPAQAGTPEGPEQICNDTTTTYTTTGASDADTLVWTLDPVDAGTLTPNGQEASIEWSVDFSGIALLYVTGENECGTGDPSDNLEIEVFATPQPVISGDTFTCQYYQGIVYTTANNPDNTYTWEISGGTIASGAGTHEVSVDWGAPGQGWLRVTEESPEGCNSTTEDYLVTIDECVGIEELPGENIRIYPNPANDYVNIEVTVEYRDEIMIRIMDLAGRTVAQYEEKANKGLIKINISDLDKGIYAIEVINEGFGRITRQLVKQ